MNIRVLTAEDVRAALPMPAAIEAMKLAYGRLSADQAQVPLRSRLESPEVGGVALVMPARLDGSGEMAVKLVSVFPQNPEQNLPTIHALVVVLDAHTGRPLALLEGAELTALRTGAGSGAATDTLARPDASSAAIFGSGAQARTQLEAVCAVRKIKTAFVYSPTEEHARAFAAEMAGKGSIPEPIHVADSPEQAVREAEIICTATTSHTPVFPGELLRAGAHVNAVGSFTPEMEEVDLTTLQRARVFVDSQAAALEEAGDLLGPIRRGEYKQQDIAGEIGEVMNGDLPGRTAPEQITYFKSVGVAVQDAAAAARALTGAQREGLGQLVEL